MPKQKKSAKEIEESFKERMMDTLIFGKDLDVTKLVIYGMFSFFVALSLAGYAVSGSPAVLLMTGLFLSLLFYFVWYFRRLDRVNRLGSRSRRIREKSGLLGIHWKFAKYAVALPTSVMIGFFAAVIVSMVVPGFPDWLFIAVWPFAAFLLYKLLTRKK